MAVLKWDQDTERLFETGVDKGVLFPKTTGGAYGDGVAWNGLTGVTERPSGAESNKKYADNKEYANLISKEDFAFTIEAFTYPDEFAECDGSEQAKTGVYLGQQTRKGFGFCYRTLIGNDEKGDDYGYKLHLVYNCLASPSERSRATVNETPDMTTMSWEVTTTPTEVEGYKPVAHIVIDSTKADPDMLADLEELLYGTTSAEPELPSPDDVIDMFTPVTPGP